MDNDTALSLQATIELAALLELLEEKGILTEAEYMAKYNETKKILMDSLMEEFKKKL